MLLKSPYKLVFTSILALSVMLALMATHAEEIVSNTNEEISKEAAFTQNLETALVDIEKQDKVVKSLEDKADGATGLSKKAYDSRLIKARSKLLEGGLSFAKLVINHEASEPELDKYRLRAIEILKSYYGIVKGSGDVIREQIAAPKETLSAAEQAAAYSKIFAALDTINHTFELYIESLDLLKLFEQDVNAQENLFIANLEERAANGSILLEIAMEDEAALKASVSAVPDDAELKAKLHVASNHVFNLAHALSQNLVMMNDLEIDTAEYQQQVLSATGEITKEVFEEGVISIMYREWSQKLWAFLSENGPQFIFKIILFLGIVFVFRKLGSIAQRLAERGFKKSRVKPSELLRRMVVSIIRNTFTVIGVLIALSQIGINLGPLLAGLGVVGFVVGFALQDSLSNFAAGMMILFYRPFDVGDFVEACGISGLVSDMSLANTTILTFDNQKIIVPNNKIWGDVIKNVTAQKIRRVDLIFGISYSDDIPRTEKVLQEVVDANEMVLKSHDVLIKVHELGDSSVNIILRPWVNTEDYWDVYWDITRAVKMRFDEEGISIPFPQRDVHVHNV